MCWALCVRKMFQQRECVFNRKFLESFNGIQGESFDECARNDSIAIFVSWSLPLVKWELFLSGNGSFLFHLIRRPIIPLMLRPNRIIIIVHYRWIVDVLVSAHTLWMATHRISVKEETRKKIINILCEWEKNRKSVQWVRECTRQYLCVTGWELCWILSMDGCGGCRPH